MRYIKGLFIYFFVGYIATFIVFGFGVVFGLFPKELHSQHLCLWFAVFIGLFHPMIRRV